MNDGLSHAPRILDSQVVDCVFGPNVCIVRPANLYGCRIGEGCFIGPFTEIQQGAVIGRGTRIQSHAFVCEMVTIGDDCFIGHGVMFINDLFREGGPARGDRSKYRATRIGDRVSIGSNATILPVIIAAGVVVGAGSVVTHDLEHPGIYAGNPAKFLREL
ncbi:MAG TPA: acyltransferase [Verrucomicrobiales bacterium]|nr:acyltransferase [Verrucomicrobiales bacterium]